MVKIQIPFPQEKKYSLIVKISNRKKYKLYKNQNNYL